MSNKNNGKTSVVPNPKLILLSQAKKNMAMTRRYKTAHVQTRKYVINNKEQSQAIKG